MVPLPWGITLVSGRRPHRNSSGFQPTARFAIGISCPIVSSFSLSKHLKASYNAVRCNVLFTF